MEILLAIILLLAAGRSEGPPPKKLAETFSALARGADAKTLLKSGLFDDVRIFGMSPAELIDAAAELKTLAAMSEKAAPAPAADTAAKAAHSAEEDPAAPVAGIANEQIERMLGKYFS